MPKMAVIDTDFLNHLGELDNHDNAFDLIVRFFDALNYKVLIHPLVYKHEKKPGTNPLVERLFDEGIITVSEFFTALEKKPIYKDHYDLVTRQIYKEFTGKEFPVIDIFTEWKKEEDFGEVHSAAMCVILDYDYLLSDDNETVKHMGNTTKRITQKYINVYNRQQCCDFVRATGLMTRNELRPLAHVR